MYFLFYYFPKINKFLLLFSFFFTASLSKEHHLCQSFNLWTFTPLLLPLVAKDSSRLKLFLKVTMNGKPWWVGFVCRVSLLHFINYILNNSVFIYLFSYLNIKFGLVGENNLMYTKLEFLNKCNTNMMYRKSLDDNITREYWKFINVDYLFIFFFVIIFYHVFCVNFSNLIIIVIKLRNFLFFETI